MSSTVLEPRTGSELPPPLLSSSDEFDLFADLRKELEELSVANREILQELRSDPTLDLDGAKVETLVYSQAQWDEREQAHQAVLDEKAETIQKLEAELHEIRENGLPHVELSPEEIHDLGLKQLMAELEQRRRQLDEDEANLMRQMREMELTMAKDRAELGRQRAEVQRLQADFQRELEHAGRDSELRERLMSLQRRHLDGQAKRESESDLARPDTVAALGVSAPRPTTRPTTQVDKHHAKQSSGLFRRFFGS